jgi:iron complex transport system substrate-binding protein
VLRFPRVAVAAVVASVVLVSCGGEAEGERDGEGSLPAVPAPVTQPAAAASSIVPPPPDQDEAPQPTVDTAPDASSPTTTAATTVASPVEEAPTAQRIVVSDQAILDAALALALPVIGTPGYADRESIPSYLADRAAGVEILADRSEVNLEALAAARPDLLLFSDKLVEGSGARDELMQIANLVELEVSTARPWRDSLREVAMAAGVPGRADARIAAVEARIADARERLGADALAVEVSVVRCFVASCRYLPGGTSFSGQILDELGVARPPVQASDPEGRAFVEVSPEQVDLLNGDVIVLLGTDADDSIAALRDNPLWLELDAVRAGAVFEVDGSAWFTGNVIAIETIIDDVVRLLG